MINAISLSSVRDYDAWVQSGGVARTGIPDQNFQPVNINIHVFRGLGSMFVMQLAGINEMWEKLSLDGGNTPRGDNIVRAFLGALAARLSAATAAAGALQGQAGVLKATVQMLYGVIERYMRADADAIQNAEVEKIGLDAVRITQVALYNAARSELEGDKGFLNGFLTGLTAGAYNPVKENMDRAQKALESANASISRINSLLATIRTRQAEMQASAQAVTRIEGVDSSVVQCQNVLNGAQRTLADALTKIEHADEATRAAVMRIYLNQATPIMATLREWQSAFAALA